MLRSIRQLIDYRIVATDGELGWAEDFYFDDYTWGLRYLVVSLERSITGREVLISPACIKEPDWNSQIIPVNLTVRQVESSPDVDTDLPVSRQQEAKLAEHYPWAPWWGMMAMGMPPMTVPAPIVSGQGEDLPPGDPSLRSVNEVGSYSIHARDGHIGRVEDFLADTDTWVIRYIQARTRKWLPGRKVLLSPAWLERVDWVQRQVSMNLTREEIKGSPLFNPAAPINREYEGKLFDYYGRPRYWEAGSGL